MVQFNRKRFIKKIILGSSVAQCLSHRPPGPAQLSQGQRMGKVDRCSRQVHQVRRNPDSFLPVFSEIQRIILINAQNCNIVPQFHNSETKKKSWHWFSIVKGF